jgi:malate synthase
VVIGWGMMMTIRKDEDESKWDWNGFPGVWLTIPKLFRRLQGHHMKNEKERTDDEVAVAMIDIF